MAFALGFPNEVTALIYSMRDWRLEEVKAVGGTPSSFCFQTPMDEDLGFDALPACIFPDLPLLPAIVPVLPCVEAAYGSRGHGSVTILEKDGGWIHARRNAWDHRITVHQWNGDPAVIRLPNQNLNDLQDRLDAKARELWQHEARSMNKPSFFYA